MTKIVTNFSSADISVVAFFRALEVDDVGPPDAIKKDLTEVARRRSDRIRWRRFTRIADSATA